MSNTKNAVILTVDRNMFFPALVVAEEAANSERSETYQTIIVTERGSLPEGFAEWHAQRGSKFHVREVDYPEAISAHPSLSRRFPASSLFRLQLPEFFGDQFDRILYLDADTRINHPLAPLFHLNLDGLPVAAADDLTSSTLHTTGRLGQFRTQKLRQKAGLKPSLNHRYANTGVLLIDVKAWRHAGVSGRALAFLAANQDLCEFPDQDAFNAALETPYCLLSPHWNSRTDTGIQHHCAGIMDPAIVHYAGYFKPWYRKYWDGDPDCAERYVRFFADTPWPNAPGDPEWIDCVEAQVRTWREEALREEAALPASRKGFNDIIGEASCILRRTGKDIERVFRKSRRGAMTWIANALGIPFSNPETVKRQITAEKAKQQKRQPGDRPHVLENYLLRTPFDDVRQRLIPRHSNGLDLGPMGARFQPGGD